MTTVLHIEGMSCAHCVKHVKDALEEIAGVSGAAVDLAAKTATVEHADAVSVDALRAAVEDAGYDVV